MDGKYLEQMYLLTQMDRLLDCEKNEDVKRGIEKAKILIEKMPVTYNVRDITQDLYSNPDAKMPTGELVIKVEKAVDIVNGVFRRKDK